MAGYVFVRVLRKIFNMFLLIKRNFCTSSVIYYRVMRIIMKVKINWHVLFRENYDDVN